MSVSYEQPDSSKTPTINLPLSGFYRSDTEILSFIMRHFHGFERSLLVVILLLFQGIQNAVHNSLYVSHRGTDLNGCGNRDMPCRTVRYAVRKSNVGDEIYIDYAQGRPYLECENQTQSTCSIQLGKSLSLYGINGNPEIRCYKGCKLFKITNTARNITRVKFVNLIISNTNIVTELEENITTHLVFYDMLIRDNIFIIFGKRLADCSLQIFNSSLENNYGLSWGIYLQSANLTVHIDSSTFKLVHILFTNVANFPKRPKRTRILVRNTVFDYGNPSTHLPCFDMIRIQPFTTVLNVTIIGSRFQNHACRKQVGTVSQALPAYSTSNQFYALHIFDSQSDFRNTTFIFMSDLTFENNYSTGPALSLALGYQETTKFDLLIRRSIFKNNSQALQMQTRCFARFCHRRSSPTLYLENNTFAENVYKHVDPHGAAAIYFDTSESRVTSCRFLDNKPGNNPYTGVVTISETATVTFVNNYFENRQTEEQANQVFATGSRRFSLLGENTFNFVGLREGGQSVFSRIPTVGSPGVVIVKKDFKILCPRGYHLSTQRDCSNIKNAYWCHYITVQCEQCPTKTYALDRGEFIFNTSNNIQCWQCPRDGNCDSGLITAKPNFWGYKNKTKVVFLQCPPGYCCEDCVTYNGCQGNRSGILCGQCPKGMSESLFSTQCISNTQCSMNYFFILGTITLLALYLVFFLYHKEIVNFLRRTLLSNRLSFPSNRGNEQGNNRSSSSGIIKIFFYYYQVCNLLRSSVGSHKNGNVFHNVGNVISRVMNMILVNLPFFQCPLKNLHAVPKTVILHSVGYCLLSLLFLLYLMSKLISIIRRLKSDGNGQGAMHSVIATSSDETRRAGKSSTQRIASAFTYISLLMYASSAQLCLSLLRCVPFGDNQVLFLDGNIKCHQTFQYFLLAYIISSILPFCLVPVLGSYLLKFDRIGVKQFCAACIFPLPFCCYWMYLLAKKSSWRRRFCCHINSSSQPEDNVLNEIVTENLREETQLTSCKSSVLRVLQGPFRPHQATFIFPSSNIPWEGFLIFRRLALILVLTFVQDNRVKAILSMLLCVAILLPQIFVWPFKSTRDNVLETLSLAMLIIISGLNVVKSIYYGGESNSGVWLLLNMVNVIESILITLPVALLLLPVIVFILWKVAMVLRACVQALYRGLKRSDPSPSEDWTREGTQSLLSSE